MPRVGEIEAALFEIAPRACAMDWDNVGLLVGKPGREVKRFWCRWTLRRPWQTRRTAGGLT